MYAVAPEKVPQQTSVRVVRERYVRVP